MYASTSFTSHFVHDLLVESHSRRLLLESALHQAPNSPPPTTTNTRNSTDLYLGDGTFDANVVMVLSVLLCALICSLGLNSIIRCALRCSDLVIDDPSSSSRSSSSTTASSRLANKGIKKKALKTFPTISYSSELKLPGLDTECVICLSEFSNGDKVRVLPKCNHGFHVKCIDKWLSSHSSCPKCRQCLIHTCQKIVETLAAPSPSPSPPAAVQPVPETIIRIEPLEQESMVRNYREVQSSN